MPINHGCTWLSRKNLQPIQLNTIDDLVGYGRKKLVEKNCDLIVANDIDGGKIFGSDVSCGYLIDEKEVVNYGKISKVELAGLIVNKVLEKINGDNF